MKKHILAVVAAVSVLSACADTGFKEIAGGAVTGGGMGYGCSHLGAGMGKVYLTAGCTLVGYFLGSQIGRSLDKADNLYATQATNQAASAPIGQKVTWSNPSTQNTGMITPTREGRDQSGNYCREYQSTISVGGRVEQTYGTACRQGDGTWKVMQ